MSVLSLAALAIARDQLARGVHGGQLIDGVQWGRHRHPWIDGALADVGLPNPEDVTVAGSPQCAACIYKCFELAVEADKTGIAINPCPKTAGALHLYERAPLRCRTALPAPGDVGVLSHGGGHGHAFICESVSPSGDEWTTIEFDTYLSLAEAIAAGDPTARNGDMTARHTWRNDGSRGVLLGWLDL